jgi:hypothetical protein
MINVFLFIGALLVTFILVELVLHAMVRPSAGSSGTFRDIELPR